MSKKQGLDKNAIGNAPEPFRQVYEDGDKTKELCYISQTSYMRGVVPLISDRTNSYSKLIVRLTRNKLGLWCILA